MRTVRHQHEELFQLGRAGQWVLHNEELYQPAMVFRGDRQGVPLAELDIDLGFPGSFGLYYAGSWPLPDFTDPAYWEDMVDHLADMIADVRNGAVQAGFEPEDAMALELKDRKAEYASPAARQKRVDKVEAWVMRSEPHDPQIPVRSMQPPPADSECAGASAHVHTSQP